MTFVHYNYSYVIIICIIVTLCNDYMVSYNSLFDIIMLCIPLLPLTLLHINFVRTYSKPQVIVQISKG